MYSLNIRNPALNLQCTCMWMVYVFTSALWKCNVLHTHTLSNVQVCIYTNVRVSVRVSCWNSSASCWFTLVVTFDFFLVIIAGSDQRACASAAPAFNQNLSCKNQLTSWWSFAWSHLGLCWLAVRSYIDSLRDAQRWVFPTPTHRQGDFEYELRC